MVESSLNRTFVGLLLAGVGVLAAGFVFMSLAIGSAGSPIGAGLFVLLFLGLPAGCCIVLALLALASAPAKALPRDPQAYLEAIDLPGECPNCGAIIPVDSKECRHCTAVFGHGAAWKVLPLRKATYRRERPHA